MVAKHSVSCRAIVEHLNDVFNASIKRLENESAKEIGCDCRPYLGEARKSSIILLLAVMC